MSKISWTDATWNPVTGCTRASSGCDNCYAVTMTKRLAEMKQQKYIGLVNENKSHFNGVVKCHEDSLEVPLKWNKPKRIFVNSMSDLFHPNVPFEFIDKVLGVIALCPQHIFQVLTKRPERMEEYFSSDSRIGSNLPLYNLWLGTSVENQEAANERIPHLLNCPATVRFLSCEPLIGQIALTRALEHGINWVIVGGESGRNYRNMEIKWLTDIVDQCREAGVPAWVKQDSHARNEQQGRIPDNYFIQMMPGEK